MLFINKFDSLIFPASDCYLAMVLSLQKSVLRVPNSKMIFPTFTAIFLELLKIELNHNIEKEPTCKDGWVYMMTPVL